MRKAPKMESWHSPAEVADLVGIDIETVYRLLRAGTLRADTIGKVYRISSSAITELKTILNGMND